MILEPRLEKGGRVADVIVRRNQKQKKIGEPQRERAGKEGFVMWKIKIYIYI